MQKLFVFIAQKKINMHDYEKVNHEIEEFINRHETRPSTIAEEVSVNSNKNELVNLLTELLDIYRDIQNMLENKDFENVKDKILNSDVKNALVCESLMKILKDECSEKADIKKQYQEEKNKIKKIEAEKQELSVKISKMESDIEFTKRSNKELSRVIRDQKNLLIAAKERAELERKACDSIKNVNKELEILRTKAYNRVNTFETEIKVLKDKLIEKDKNIKANQIQIKELENEKQQLNKKISNLEKINESLKNKLESKDKSLNLVNGELAKMINKDKKNEELLEEIKEKASYYERLYKATNKQNEYLNSQLAKMINLENVDKLEKGDVKIDTSDLSLVTTQSKEVEYKNKFKKYKKKCKIHRTNEEKKQAEINEIKKSIERLRLENRRLQDEKEQALSGNNKITETLMNKVESLLEQNRGYQNKLVDKQVKFETNDQFNESFKTVNEVEEDSLVDFKYTKNNDPWKKNTENTNTFVMEDLNYDDVFGKHGETKIRGEDESTLFLDSTKFRRPFKLANEYEEKIPEVKNEMKSYKNAPALSIPRNFYSSLSKREVPEKDILLNNERRNDIYNRDDQNTEEVKSIDSSKSVKTTSSLKDMLKKTEDLQNRFEDLEKQLDEINGSDLPPSKKIHDQIKAYTDYYYSDYLDLSNENDIL
jgi:chromosome segregation ATPase